MGLAGQKTVQRISSDPNNLNWSNDTSKFGFRMMAKMGWAPGKGLGVNEDGSQQHVKVKLKDDTLGLGAKKNTTENWLGNTDAFSRLLADLNSRPTTPNTEEENDDTEEIEKDANDDDKDKKGKKRKSISDGSDEDSDEVNEKKKKKSKKDKKEKKSKKEKKDKKDRKEKKEKKNKKEKEKVPVPTPAPLRNAARAKFLKAKRMAVQNSSSLNEILGLKA
ncbi:G-patch domain-containing protein [Cunninghamella echinulata]|nr:G-patch domain-containing protein [Cunninghamella echinulata]